MSVVELEKLLNVDEALEVLGISRTMLHEYVRKGELAAVKFGRRTLFKPGALRAFVDRHETQVEPATANVRGL